MFAITSLVLQCKGKIKISLLSLFPGSSNFNNNAQECHHMIRNLLSQCSKQNPFKSILLHTYHSYTHTYHSKNIQESNILCKQKFCSEKLRHTRSFLSLCSRGIFTQSFSKVKSYLRDFSYVILQYTETRIWEKFLR